MHPTRYAYLNKLLLLEQLGITTHVYAPQIHSIAIFLEDAQRCKALLCTHPEPYIRALCRELLDTGHIVFMSEHARKVAGMTFESVSSTLLASRD